MSYLRSSLFIAIVSLFVLTGYAWDVLDYCCEDESQVQVDHAKSHSGKKAPEKKNSWKCICHQIFSGPEVELVRVDPRVPTPTDYIGHPDEAPPEAVPLGIDYPPQLA